MEFFKINLQLFANGLNVTTDNTLGNNLSAEMKTFYDMTLIDMAQAQLVHDQFGQKKPIPAGGGKIIEFRSFNPLPKVVSTLTEGVTPNGEDLDVTSFTSEVSQYGSYVKLSDVLELTTIDNVIVETTKLIGRQAGTSLDTVTRNVLNAGGNVSYAPTVAGGVETPVSTRAGLDETAQLTVKVIQKVVAKLRVQNAPTINGKYVAIAHPYVIYALMRDPEWIDAHKYTNVNNIYEGEVGEIAGVRFVQTTEAKVWRNAADTHSIFSTLFIADGAYGVTEITGGGLQTIIKQKGSAGTADPLDQRSTIGWKAIKTAEILIPSYLVRVESCVADFDNTPAN